MRIHVYANCWNEIRLLPYFLRHYDPFVEKFVILDDGSTDGSVEFLRGHQKVRLISSNRQGGSYIEHTCTFFNEAWKGSRSDADWIITCNIDEHIYHRNLLDYFWRCQQEGVTILPANGYEMVSLTFPSTQGRLCDLVRFGTPTEKLTGPSSMHSKIMAFNPRAIQEISFGIGRHKAHPKGNAVYPATTGLCLLHYKYLGLDYTILRYAELKTGLTASDIKEGAGCQYLWDRRTICRHFSSVVTAAGVVIPAGFVKDTQLALTFLPWKLILPFLDAVRIGWRMVSRRR